MPLPRPSIICPSPDLEAHLPQRCGLLAAIQNEGLLYGVTSADFEGQVEAPQEQRLLPPQTGLLSRNGGFSPSGTGIRNALRAMATSA